MALTRVLDVAEHAYLATVEGGAPHLSLMRYTFQDLPELGHVLILTTRRDTKKFAALIAQPKVAVLIHDFQAGSHETGTLSITVYGNAVEMHGEVAERLRAAHVARNPHYEQFIIGDNIAVISVQVTLARMCTVGDIVETWEHPRARGTSLESAGGALSQGVGGGAAEK